MYGNDNIAMTFLINGTKDEAWLDGVYEKTRMSWQPYKEFQTLNNGVDEVNWSIDDDANFAQFKFKMYANSTDTNILYNFNATFDNFSAGGAAAPSTCDCPTSGNWEIDDASVCTLSTTCNIGTNKLRINDGALLIQASGYLRTGGCYVADTERLFVDDEGGLFCGG